MPSRVAWLLLCMLLIAKGSVAAVLSVTGAAGYSHPAADACPFTALAAFAGLHDDAASRDDDAPAVEQPTAVKGQLHHHHTCQQLCQLQGATSTAAALPVSGGTATATPMPADFTSFVLSPPRHPPRHCG